MSSFLPRANDLRLWSRLMAMAEVGTTRAGGSNREALTDADSAGRQLFEGWAVDAGCTLELDQIGNLFARREGLDTSLPPILVGSHLDTQPTGGKFDGVYGVLAGLEVLECLNDHNIKTQRGIEVVVWTNEEGSRFPLSMMGSGVWAGEVALNDAYRLTDSQGVSVEAELKRLGWIGPTKSCKGAAYLELHIEQGPILEAEALDIGVVTGVQGFRWYELTLTGEAAHAGPTPMSCRVDPARAISRIIDVVYRETEARSPWARATFSRFQSEPDSANTVPEQLTCWLDLRHPDLEVLNEFERTVRSHIERECAALGVGYDLAARHKMAPVHFDGHCVDAVRAAATALGLRSRDIISGAGHDACNVSRIMPTSMIFVPCRDGISHNPVEEITRDQAVNGASTLLRAVIALAAE